jgi:hypothetical protein
MADFAPNWLLSWISVSDIIFSPYFAAIFRIHCQGTGIVSDIDRFIGPLDVEMR